MKKIILSLIVFFCSTAFYAQMKEEIVQMEGIYVKTSEVSAFYEQSEGALYSPIWLEFDKTFKLDKKQQNKLFKYNEKGVFIRVVGVKKTGGEFGNSDEFKAEIVVTKILFIGKNQTLENTLFDKG